MTISPPEAPTPGATTGPRVSPSEMRELGRLRREPNDRYVAGLCGGLGRHFDVDPILFRVAFVVTAILGIGVFAYLALWLVVPLAGNDRGAFGLEPRTRAAVIVVVAAIAAISLVAGGADGPDSGLVVPALIIGLVVWILARRRDERELGGGAMSYAAPPQAAASGAAPGVMLASPTADSTTGSGAGPIGDPGAAADSTEPRAIPPATPPVAPRLLPAYHPKPPNPKKRGPLLFGFTLAAIALGMGLLGLADTAGAQISASAYPALALAISGVMLVIGSSYGRAGGVIFLGLMSLMALGIVSAAEHAPQDTLQARPTQAAKVQNRYEIESGTIDLDLSQVDDPAALAGRTLTVRAEVGNIQLTVPRGVDVVVNSRVEGVGAIDILNNSEGGIDLSRYDRLAALDSGNIPPTQPLVINTKIGVGLLEVTR